MLFHLALGVLSIEVFRRFPPLEGRGLFYTSLVCGEYRCCSVGDISIERLLLVPKADVPSAPMRWCLTWAIDFVYCFVTVQETYGLAVVDAVRAISISRAAVALRYQVIPFRPCGVSIQEDFYVPDEWFS